MVALLDLAGHTPGEPTPGIEKSCGAALVYLADRAHELRERAASGKAGPENTQPA
jgi:hypothetical protein